LAGLPPTGGSPLGGSPPGLGPQLPPGIAGPVPPPLAGGGPPLGGPLAPPPQGAAPSPFSPPFTDLSTKLAPAWQLVDAGITCFESAINTGGLYRQPEALAGVREIVQQSKDLMANYGQGAEDQGAPKAQPALEDTPVKPGGETVDTEPAPQAPDSGETEGG